MYGFSAPVSLPTPSFVFPVGTCSLEGRGRLSIAELKKKSSNLQPIRAQVTTLNGDDSPLPYSPGERLVSAAMIGDTLDVISLLAEGVSANFESQKGESGMTALMWAAAEGHLDIAEQLLKAGAHIDARNAQGATALLFAVENLPSAKPKEAPPAGFPGRPGPQPEQVKIQPRITGHMKIAHHLMSKGADLGITNGFDESLLHMTSRKAQDGLVRELLIRGVDINRRSVGSQETALHVAAKESHTAIVALLCELGADVEARSRFGWTPLLWAAACGWENVVEELIERGANVNVKAGEGEKLTTPLKEAGRCACPQQMRKLLIRAGAFE